MTFPVTFHILGLRMPAHLAMEALAYVGGFQIYALLRRRWKGPMLPAEQNIVVIAACVFGALIGSKLLACLESPLDYYYTNWRNPQIWVGGKTIVGGLLGGWGAVEIVKKRLGINYSVGDILVAPLIFGMAVGRIGCFLTGLGDHTYGNKTSLPWAVDFGDGPRHPTQLYDIIFLLLLGLILYLRRRGDDQGRTFKWFLAGYLLWRFLVEFIKPRYHPYLGLSMIQIVSLAGAVLLLCLLYAARRRHPLPAAE